MLLEIPIGLIEAQGQPNRSSDMGYGLILQMEKDLITGIREIMT